MSNIKIIIKLFFVVFILNIASSFSQTVTVDLEQQRFLGDVSSLDRSKYFNIHSGQPDQFDGTFITNNNVTFGRRFFGPFADRSFVNPIGNFPNTPATSDGNVRSVQKFIATANPKSVWRPGYSIEEASNAAVRYFIDEVNTQNRPEYWEPFNEPFVKAFDTAFDNDVNTGQPVSNTEVIIQMSNWFKGMANKIHSTPELAKMKVIGFSDAFPSFERRGFSNWRDRQKRFIDIAGAEMDAMSVHPYDGVNVVGQANGRSGSNSEAILDLVETYTSLKFGQPKKLAISEFGVIEDGSLYPDGYNESESALTVRGLNNMLFNFIERQDNIEITIPFITGRADFYYNDDNNIPTKPYIPAIVRPTQLLTTRNPNSIPRPNLYRNNTMVLAWKANFYTLWKNVKGDRATATSDDLDIQTQVFVNGNTVYLAVNNLDDVDKIVNLNFISGLTNVTNVITSSIVVNGLNQPTFDPGTTSTAIPASIQLKNGETKILEITYGSPIVFNKSIIREKYYGTINNLTDERAPVLLAQANTAHAYSFTGIDKGSLNDGIATLRLGVGVPLVQEFVNGNPSEGLTILPDQVTVNGTAITIPANWKGYDQDGRVEFFGTLEMDVPYNLLNTGANTVTIRYNTTEGQSIINVRDAAGNDAFERANTVIASVILSVERKEGLCTPQTLYADEDNDGLGDPNTTISSCGPAEGFVDNADDMCINDTDNNCVVNIPGIVQAEFFQNGAASGVQVTNNGIFIGFINNGDSTEYTVNVTTAGNYNMTINAAAANDAGGTITAFVGGTLLETFTITPTGGFDELQGFSKMITLQAGMMQNLRLEYSGTGNGGGFLFDIDSIVFEDAGGLGVEDFSTANLRLNKNPVESDVSFSSNTINGEPYKIFSVTGKLMRQGIYNQSINVDAFSSGLYFIRLKGAVVKFIKVGN